MNRIRPVQGGSGRACFLVTGAIIFGLFGGHLRGDPPVNWESGFYAKAEARIGRVADDSFWSAYGDNTLADLSGTARWMTTAESESVFLDFQVDLTGTMGDTRERMLAAGFEGGANGFGRGNGISSTNDNRRLVDLTRTLSEGNRHLTTARIDRLALTLSPSWGTVRIGRQAVTWGGGLAFNPFDLFNPFAPSDVARDFKTGDDMIFLDLPQETGGFQILGVARRDPETGSVASDQTSVAGQYQTILGNGEFFALAAWHYDQPVAGAGLSGLAGEAAWRVDVTWNRIESDFGPETTDYFALVANLQYSWVWAGKNVYGFLEYYHNGLGEEDYATALEDPFVLTAIARGSLFVLGSNYGVISAQVEWHPLVNLFVSAITNLEDPSALLQPRVVWDASQQFQVTFGLDIPIGGEGTEFGGFSPAGLPGTTRGPTSAYCWGTWNF